MCWAWTVGSEVGEFLLVLSHRNAPHATDGHVHRDVSQLLCAMLLLDGLEASLRVCGAALDGNSRVQGFGIKTDGGDLSYACLSSRQ